MLARTTFLIFEDNQQDISSLYEKMFYIMEGIIVKLLIITANIIRTDKPDAMPDNESQSISSVLIWT